MAQVLIIGSGAREHALAKKFIASDQVSQVFVAPGNSGMKQDGIVTVKIAELDFESLINFAKNNQIDLTFIGPEAPLQAGIVDAFRDSGLKVFGPTKAAAELEGSKHFAKKIMEMGKVPTAKYRAFVSEEAAIDYLADSNFPIVIKSNGLAAGKGVVIAQDLTAASETIHKFLGEHQFGTTEIILEEFLEGQEFSCMALINQGQIIQLPLSQDHKAAFDQDLGPNTGGMGAYSPLPQLPDLNEQTLNEVIEPTIKTLKNQGIDFTGVLYAGMILTAKGLRVIEFNVRFGDPETSVLLPQIQGDFYQLIIDLLDGTKVDRKSLYSLGNEFTLGVVVSAEDYPKKSGYGVKLTDFLNLPENLEIDFAGVDEVNGQLVSDGGRILVVKTKATSIKIAQQRIYDYLDSLTLNGLRYRHDIGYRALK